MVLSPKQENVLREYVAGNPNNWDVAVLRLYYSPYYTVITVEDSFINPNGQEVKLQVSRDHRRDLMDKVRIVLSDLRNEADRYSKPVECRRKRI